MFSTDWLTLREPADFAARSATLTRLVNAELGARRSLRALDLGSGTGANVRYIADHSGGIRDWLMVDHDPILLSHVPSRMASWAVSRGLTVTADGDVLEFARDGARECIVTTQATDLRRLDDLELFEGRALVTASALLDLVSESWLESLAAKCRSVHAVALFALSYDGRMDCLPDDPGDRQVRALVNRHQRRDKGFGPALGPGAIASCARRFGNLGYRVVRKPSDWHLGAGTTDLQRQLIDGWARAAIEISPDQEAIIEGWRQRRLSYVAGGQSTLIVGHEDLAAFPSASHS